MIRLVPSTLLQGIIAIGPDIMLHFLVAGNFVRSSPVEQLVSLAQREAIKIHPSTINPFESSMEILLVVLCSLDKTDIRERGKLLSSFGVSVASQYAGVVTTAL